MKDLIMEQLFTVIGTLISGILLIPITLVIRGWMDSSKKRKLSEEVRVEVLGVLRNIIAETDELNLSTIDILLNSSCRKKGIDKKFVSTPKMIVEDMILEVLETRYISIDVKKRISDQLQSLLTHDTGRKSLVIPKRRVPSILEFASITGGAVFVSIIAALLEGNFIQEIELSNPAAVIALITIATIILTSVGLSSVLYNKIENSEEGILRSIGDFFGIGEYKKSYQSLEKTAKEIEEIMRRQENKYDE